MRATRKVTLSTCGMQKTPAMLSIERSMLWQALCMTMKVVCREKAKLDG